MSRKGLTRPCRVCGKTVSSWGPMRDVHAECLDPSIKDKNKQAQLERKRRLAEEKK